MSTDNYRAKIKPGPDGTWSVHLGHEGADGRFLYMISNEYRVPISDHGFRTEAKARQRASKMLADLRQAVANTQRPSPVVAE